MQRIELKHLIYSPNPESSKDSKDRAPINNLVINKAEAEAEFRSRGCESKHSPLLEQVVVQ